MLERARPWLAGGLHVDIGTGDGAFVLANARAHPDAYFVGIDANPEALARASRRAASKPARGGLPNALFVRASVEALPDELTGLATSVTVLFPWGSLLQAVVTPAMDRLLALRALLGARGELRIIFGYDASIERRAILDSRLPEPSEEHVTSRLVPAYRAAGLDVRARRLSGEELAELPTTWAKKLRFGRPRTFWELRGTT